MQISLVEIKNNLGIKGKDLLTRPIARRFVPEVISKIKETVGASEAIEFNFLDIETSDTSFIDELIIVNVLEGMKSGRISRRGVYVTHLSSSTFDNMDSVFAQKKNPLLFKKELREYILLGHLEKHLIRILKLLFSKKSMRAVDVVSEFDFKISVASTKLAKLYKLNLANRLEEISEKGREYTYFSLF